MQDFLMVLDYNKLIGFNCSEAVNLAPTQWIDQHSKAVEEYRKNGNVHKVSFPIEWLIVKIMMNVKDYSFSNVHLQDVFY